MSGASKGAGVATVRKSVVTRVRDARTLRRMTVYLDVDLHKRLGRYCVDHDLDMSEAISQSLEKTLPSE